MLEALRYVYVMSIGDFGYDDYDAGDDEHLLWILLFIATFFLSIVLLNMLIAIMNSTFERTEETAVANNL